MPHSYRVTVCGLSPEGAPTSEDALTFDVDNHDDVFALVRRVQAAGAVPSDEAPAFVVGLKLFSEVLLRHRRDAPFDALFPHFNAFMKVLKRPAQDGARP